MERIVSVFITAGNLQVLGIVSECPDTSPLQVMKSRAQQLFSVQPQADDLPKDIPDLGTLGNYLLTRQVSRNLFCACVLELAVCAIHNRWWRPAATAWQNASALQINCCVLCAFTCTPV